MYFRAELSALLEELEQLDKEYEFACSHAEYHAQHALKGEVHSLFLYCGARTRMQEIESRVLVISDRIAALEEILD